MVRGALSALLGLEEDMQVVGQVSQADEVVPRALELHPDVALIDIQMSGGDGLSAGAALVRELPGCKVLILTTFGRPGYLRQAMQGGASGFLFEGRPGRSAGGRDPTLPRGTASLRPQPCRRRPVGGRQPAHYARVRGLGGGTTAPHGRRGSGRDVSLSGHRSQPPLLCHHQAGRPQSLGCHPHRRTKRAGSAEGLVSLTPTHRLAFAVCFLLCPGPDPATPAAPRRQPAHLRALFIARRTNRAAQSQERPAGSRPCRSVLRDG